MAAPTLATVRLNGEPTMDPLFSIFDSVSRRDLEGVVVEYMKNARTTLASYLSMKRQWELSKDRQDKEEKIDEYLQEMTDDMGSTSSGVAQMPPPTQQQGWRAGTADEMKYNDVLRDMTDVFAGHHCLTSLQVGVAPELSDEGDRLVGQSVQMLSNSRPPNAFTVNSRNSRGRVGPLEGPPIFDGGVANATPPPLGPPGIRPSGGAGTLLHLACAVDSPFSLAVVLALGGDARSPHTAFRRLMIHEAACGGSVRCLAILLELGKECAMELYNPEELTIATEQSEADLDLPFLPSSFDRDPRECKPAASEDKSKLRTHFEPSVSGRKNWLKILRKCFELAKNVRLGMMTELDAAREVLKLRTISESMRLIIAQSCSFIVKNSTITGNPFNSPWYSDGHGNTPLHWAAFKNERQCVALLLKFHADPNARAHPSGWTALHDAAYSNSSESVELLLDAGADVDIPANSGATPLCFAAQEDSDGAARVLLSRGANLGARCAGGPVRPSNVINAPGHPNGRFSGYTPLHYCAHYNAHRAAKVLLLAAEAKDAMEIPDLSGRFPIHLAVSRGSSDVLRELLHAGARVEVPNTSSSSASSSSPPLPVQRTRRRSRGRQRRASLSPGRDETRVRQENAPATPPRRAENEGEEESTPPVSSPLLRSMIPSRPVTSSKPWNCLTQRSIDECKALISQAEQSWAPDRHSLFTPTDRRAVVELLRVGKRLEQMGTGIFIDLWPLVLSFCGRGWFEVEAPIDQDEVMEPPSQLAICDSEMTDRDPPVD